MGLITVDGSLIERVMRRGKEARWEMVSSWCMLQPDQKIWHIDCFYLFVRILNAWCFRFGDDQATALTMLQKSPHDFFISTLYKIIIHRISKQGDKWMKWSRWNASKILNWIVNHVHLLSSLVFYLIKESNPPIGFKPHNERLWK